MLNRQNFEIAELAPDDEERLHLCGILVSPVSTSETDGHQAVIVTAAEEIQAGLFAEAEGVSPADEFTPFILDRESALKIAKAIPKTGDDEIPVHPVIDATTEDSDRAMVSINDLFRQEILRAKKLRGVFPDVTRVIPDREAARFVMALSPELLIRVLKTANKFCKAHGSTSIELRIYGPGHPPGGSFISCRRNPLDMAMASCIFRPSSRRYGERRA